MRFVTIIPFMVWVFLFLCILAFIVAGVKGLVSLAIISMFALTWFPTRV